MNKMKLDTEEMNGMLEVIDGEFDDDYSESREPEPAKVDLAILASTIQRDIDDRVSRRLTIEKRWLTDIASRKGEYDSETLAKMSTTRSRAFFRGTRKLCDFAEARVSEMVMPTDGRNFSITTTPIADLPMGMEGEIEAIQKEADARALKMQTKIDDQLVECDFNEEMRNAIADMIRLGPCIVKAPVVVPDTTRRYAKKEITEGVTAYVLEVEQKFKPAVQRIDPWNFYPNVGAYSRETTDSTAELHLMSRKKLRQLAKTPGFDKDAIRTVLGRSPGYRGEDSLRDQSASEDVDNGVDELDKTHYKVWEYNGSLPNDKAAALCGLEEADADPLEERRVIVWICDEVVLKAVEYPHDDEELPYYWVNWAEDPESIYGSGVAHECSNGQRIANGALRMLLDNAAFSALPQTIIDQGIINPQDGDYQIRPGKVWLLKKSAQDVRTAFTSVITPINVNDLLTIFQMGQKMMEDEAGLAMIMQTGQEPKITETAAGTAMLMNSASTPLRRLMRQIDGKIIKPVLQAMYRYNMQFDEDESIKGDYNVVAHGSSALLVREQQTQGLIEVLKLAQSSPILAQLTKFPELYRSIIASMQINADGVIKTDAELAQEKEAAAQQGQAGPTPEQMKMQLDQSKLQLDAAKLQLMQQEQQFEQAKAANDARLKEMELQVKAMDASSQLQSDQINAQREHERIASSNALKVAEMEASQQTTFADIQSKERMNAIKIDNENKKFNAEMQVKITQGSGI